MMRDFVEQTSNRTLFCLLAGAYLVFYTIQIPLITGNTDVLVFSVRSLSDWPIVKYAYLDERTLFDRPSLPNYHIAHTVLLWLAYHIFPSELSKTIWPSGFVSALCGALSAGLTFLIWVRLGFDKVSSFVAAVISGLIPVIWSMSLIGESYSLQLASTLIFLYFFIADNIVIATIVFLFTSLVSPINGLAIFLVFLISSTKRIIVKALICGAAALFLYVFITHFMNLDMFKSFSAITPAGKDKSVIWKVCTFAWIFLLNVNFLFPSLIRGIGIMGSQYRDRILFFGLAIVPWVLLAAMDFKFLEIPGDFFLLFFWVLCLPISLGLTRFEIPIHRYCLIIIGIVSMYISACYIPSTAIGLSRLDAGYKLLRAVPEDVKIVGKWKSGVPIVLAKYGWDLDKLSQHFLEIYPPHCHDESVLLKTGEKSLIVIIEKKNNINILQNNYVGAMQKVLEDDVYVFYKWDRSTKN